MECFVGISNETVLQVVKFYTVVKKNFLKKTAVSDCSPSPEWMHGLLQIKRCLYSDVKQDNAVR